jgi:Lhr-like helicase
MCRRRLRKQIIAEPPDLLMITPESIEVLLISAR